MLSIFCQTIEENFDAGVELYLSTWKKYLRNGAIDLIHPNKPGRFTGIDYSSNQIEKVFAHLDLLFQVAQLKLKSSNIDPGYAGPLKCHDWKGFLKPVLEGVYNHTLPYCPFFLSPAGDKFLYFHHSGEVGFYSEEKGL